MKLFGLPTRVVSVGLSVMGFVLIGLSFLFSGNNLLLSSGFVCLGLNSISAYFAQPKGERKESPLIGGLVIILLLALPAIVGFIKAKGLTF